ncbi:MAG: tol-pal system protein YbgF [Rhodospirillaceae bacterium]
MMSFKSMSRGLAAAALALLAVSGAAHAQTNVGDRLSRLEQQVQRLQGPAVSPGAAVSPSDIEGRLLSMERAIELLTGQVEEARFRSERNAEQLKVLSEDLNLRIATLEQSIGVAGGGAPGNTAAPAMAPAMPTPPRASAPAPQRFSADAPASQPMNVPRPAPPAPDVAVAANAAAPPSGGAIAANGGFVVRTDASGKPLPPDPNAPAPVRESGPPPSAPAPRASPAAPSVTGNQLAALPADIAMPNGAPKQQYDYAFDFLKRNDYVRGEAALREFLKRNPKDQLAGNAQYWLGETFYVRGNYQQAAVEFMAGYQTFPKNTKSPDSLFKLGLSLEKLNQNDGACTAFGRITKDYPDASDQVRNGVKAERTKLKCK